MILKISKLHVVGMLLLNTLKGKVISKRLHRLIKRPKIHGEPLENRWRIVGDSINAILFYVNTWFCNLSPLL